MGNGQNGVNVHLKSLKLNVKYLNLTQLCGLLSCSCENFNSFYSISCRRFFLFLRSVHMKALLCHLHSPLDMKTYSFLQKRSRTAEKRAASVRCVILPPINTAGGYYIFNGYSINCSSFFSLSGSVELFDLMFRPPCVFDIIILQSRWIKLLQAHKES